MINVPAAKKFTLEFREVLRARTMSPTTSFRTLLKISKGVVEHGSRTKGGRGVRPKAKKRKVTPAILMVEVVSDAPDATLDGSTRV